MPPPVWPANESGDAGARGEALVDVLLPRTFPHAVKQVGPLASTLMAVELDCHEHALASWVDCSTASTSSAVTRAGEQLDAIGRNRVAVGVDPTLS